MCEASQNAKANMARLFLMQVPVNLREPVPAFVKALSRPCFDSRMLDGASKSLVL